MAKRPCFSDHSPRVSKRGCDQLNIDALLESLFAVSDLSSIDASFDSLVKSRSTASDQNELLQRALNLGSVVLEAGKRHIRKCSSVHNASVWPLPTDLTIKVFSMLDTPSVCYAAATCSFFEKCARSPLCYANIDSATLGPKVNDHVVSTLIQRADNAIRSLKLRNRFDYDDEWGYRRSRQEKESPILTSSCLSYLTANGSCLRRLHLYNIKRMDDMAICTSLSVCPSLIDLKIEGMDLCKEPRGGEKLEVIILQKCGWLKKYYIEKFMEALLDGKLRRLRHVDVSNEDGLSNYEDDYEDYYEDKNRSYKLSSTLLKRLLKRLLKKRPSLRFVAEFYV